MLPQPVESLIIGRVEYLAYGIAFRPLHLDRRKTPPVFRQYPFAGRIRKAYLTRNLRHGGANLRSFHSHLISLFIYLEICLALSGNDHETPLFGKVFSGVADT